MLDSTTYSQYLKNASAVVHSMGIILEGDYKGVLQGKESPITGLQRAFKCPEKPSFSASERKAAMDRKQVTYGTMNTESGWFILYIADRIA